MFKSAILLFLVFSSFSKLIDTHSNLNMKEPQLLNFKEFNHCGCESDEDAEDEKEENNKNNK